MIRGPHGIPQSKMGAGTGPGRHRKPRRPGPVPALPAPGRNRWPVPRSGAQPVALPPLDDRFSARRGTYRVIFRIDDKAHIVTVVDIGHRRDVYRTR